MCSTEGISWSVCRTDSVILPRMYACWCQWSGCVIFTLLIYLPHNFSNVFKKNDHRFCLIHMISSVRCTTWLRYQILLSLTFIVCILTQYRPAESSLGGWLSASLHWTSAGYIPLTPGYLYGRKVFITKAVFVSSINQAAVAQSTSKGYGAMVPLVLLPLLYPSVDFCSGL